MASYAYTAINSQGVSSDGEVNAPTVEAAREQLRVRGLLTESLKEVTGEDSSAAGFFKAVKPKALQVFSRQFATMIESGLNVVAALTILEDQTEDPTLAAVVRQLRSDVEGGLLLSQAMSRHPKVFNRLYVSMVRAGETGGVLDSVLLQLAAIIEKQNIRAQ